MFSKEERCLYQNNQLGDVICQLRFPEILTIGTTVPAVFQEAIRDEFPQYAVRQEAPAPKITGAPGNFSIQNQPQTVNYQFTSADGNWRVNLTSKFISLACRGKILPKSWTSRWPLSSRPTARHILNGWDCGI